MEKKELIVTVDDKVKRYNAVTGNSNKMDEEEGLEIEIVDVVQFETYNKRKEEDGICTVLFAADGTLHSTMSPTVDDGLHNLVDVFGAPSADNKIKVRIVKMNGKNGRFLQLMAI